MSDRQLPVFPCKPEVVVESEDEMTRIDHIVVAVRDLGAVAEHLWRRFGLRALPGGEHDGAGTANMIVPVGHDQFLELLAVTNPHSQHPMVHCLSKWIADGDRLAALALGVESADTAAARLNEPIFETHRNSPDGRRVGFKVTGVLGTLSSEILPFFVETTVGREYRCGFEPARNRVVAEGIRWVEFGSDAGGIAKRINDSSVPIRYVAGRPGVSAIGIAVGADEIELRL
jgi:hypothetical protein